MKVSLNARRQDHYSFLILQKKNESRKKSLSKDEE